MTDPISAAAGVATVTEGGFGLMQFLWSKVREVDVIAAVFDPAGNRVEGDARIAVQRLGDSDGRPDHWWYLPVGVTGFEFVPYATNPYLELQFAHAQAASGPLLVWRWVFAPARGFVWNGERAVGNAATTFIVIGYKPSAIVRHFLRTQASV